MTPVLRIGSVSGQSLQGAQHYRVAVCGANVQRIRPEIDIRTLPDPEEQMIDPVALLAASAAEGLFSGSAGVGGKIQAHAQRLSDTRPNVVHWSLLLDGVDLGALRVLADMLMCRPFDSAEIVADEWDAGAAVVPPAAVVAPAAVVRPAMLAYPSCVVPREFALLYERPTKSRGQRGVRLVFAQEPSDEMLDRVIGSLDAWGNLLMAGAYAGDFERGPGVFAEQATLEEPAVVAVSLQVHAGVDELMFSPLVNLARRIHTLHAPLERLEIL